MLQVRILDLSPVFEKEEPKPFVRVDFERELSNVEEMTDQQVRNELDRRFDEEFFRDLRDQ